MRIFHLQAIVHNPDGLNSVKKIKEEKLRVVKNGFNELWLIESDFVKPMLKSPKDLNRYSVAPDQLKYSFLLIHEDKKELKKNFPFVFSYINYGERKNIHHAKTLANRNKWYDVGIKSLPELSFNYIVNDIGRTYRVKAFAVNNFHNIYVQKNLKSIWLYMNSTISWLIQQLVMRSNLGDGAGLMNWQIF